MFHTKSIYIISSSVDKRLYPFVFVPRGAWHGEIEGNLERSLYPENAFEPIFIKWQSHIFARYLLHSVTRIHPTAYIHVHSCHHPVHTWFMHAGAGAGLTGHRQVIQYTLACPLCSVHCSAHTSVKTLIPAKTRQSVSCMRGTRRCNGSFSISTIWSSMWENKTTSSMPANGSKLNV